MKKNYSIIKNLMQMTSKNIYMYSKDRKFINLELASPEIEKKQPLINAILQKHSFMKTYEKQLPLYKSNDLSLERIIQISGIHKCESFSKINQELKAIGVKMIESPSVKVPWFPTKLSDVNLIGKTLFTEKQVYNEDHPYFTDSLYRKRRDKIVQIASNYKIEDEIPNIDYTQEQNALWRKILKSLRPLHHQYFCSRYLQKFDEVNKIFKVEDRIPQLSQLSNYLNQQTGFRIKPVHGIVSQREFLNALAFKVFLSTQYLRHPSIPEYTPEPDIVHEIVGHVPMFADEYIAKLSQRLGQISLGASDEEIKKIGTLYFVTVEFGVCRQNNQNKIFGAGFASCIQEILNFSSEKAQFKIFNPEQDCFTKTKIKDLQDFYCVTESFEKGLDQIMQYGEKVKKEVKTIYNPITKEIQYDKSIQTFWPEQTE